MLHKWSQNAEERCRIITAHLRQSDTIAAIAHIYAAMRSLHMHTCTHTHTPIQRYNRRFFSLCPHTPTQLYTIAADDMCTCMFLYVYLVMKNHIECDQLLHKSRALKNYTWLQFVIEIFKSEIQLFTFHEWQPSKRLEAKCRCRAIPMDQRVGIRAHVVQTNVF